MITKVLSRNTEVILNIKEKSIVAICPKNSPVLEKYKGRFTNLTAGYFTDYYVLIYKSFDGYKKVKIERSKELEEAFEKQMKEKFYK